MKKNKIYFPNLNGLRFIAAFLVLIHHVEQLKAVFNMDNYWETSDFIKIVGKLGVILFFVLSGFLITYLLVAEQHTFKKISIRKFYMRRVLRIWPLYFLIVALAFFILPNVDMFNLPNENLLEEDFSLKILLYIVLLPNLVLSIYGAIPFASHLWSIGTEEQFYIIWPLIMRYIKRNQLVLMCSVVVIYLLVKLLLYPSVSGNMPYHNALMGFWHTFPVSCMAIGGFFAILLFQQHRFLKYFLRNDLFYFSIVFTTTLMLLGVRIPFIHYEFYAFFYGIIILNFSANTTIKISLENKVFNYLGNISYGLYMYHPIAITASLYILNTFNLATDGLIYALSIAITIVVSGLSYRYFETYFLRFKSKFSKIQSGIKVKNEA
ncbi:MAG: acyltransferase [Bacteroidota bacterium]